MAIAFEIKNEILLIKIKGINNRKETQMKLHNINVWTNVDAPTQDHTTPTQPNKNKNPKKNSACLSYQIKM